MATTKKQALVRIHRPLICVADGSLCSGAPDTMNLLK